MEFVFPALVVLAIIAAVVFIAFRKPKNQGGGGGKNPGHNTDQH